MKFNTEGQPIERDDDIVGNVYRCKGGNKTRYWIIIAASPRGVVCLGINEDGEITSSCNYGRHVFDGFPFSRDRIGKVIEMPDMAFTIQWEHLR